MRKHPKVWWLAGSLALVVAGCGGGGGGGNDNGAGNGGGTVTPTDPGTPVAPSQPNLAERIEPFDTATKSAAVASKSDAAVVRGVASGAAIERVTLAAPASNLKQSTLKAAVDALPGTPVQIGVQRDVTQTSTVASTAALLHWKSASNGARVAAIAFESPSAQGVRLGVLVQQLPVGAVMRFYDEAGAEGVELRAAELQAHAEQLRNSGADEDAARTYWSPDFGGAQTVVEIEIGTDADASQVQIAVPKLSHFAYGPEQMQKAVAEKASGACNIDAMCQPEYLNQGRAVARMTYVSGNGAYYCTGTLLNDAKSSRTPYFLTAHHCISTQVEASSLVTDWFYTSSACNSGTISSGTQRLTKGASLLYATASTDTSFLQLNEMPPAGVVYAGSYYGGTPSAGSGIIGVHHPDGDPLKLSVGTVKGLGQCANESCLETNDAASGFISVTWQQGTTERGSSGSALFHAIGSTRYVAGQLYGGSAACDARNAPDYYGRFDTPYKASIKQWLNP